MKPIHQIETPIGVLSIKQSFDQEYPGYYLCINDVEMALFEYNASSHTHDLHVWLTEDEESTEDPITYKYKPEFAKEETSL